MGKQNVSRQEWVFKGVLDPTTNPLIDNKGRSTSVLSVENEIGPAAMGKEANTSEWEEAKVRSTVKLQHPAISKHITNTDNGYKTFHYIA